MPTLNLFAACERVLIDPISDMITLVGVLDRVLPEAISHETTDDGTEAKFLMPHLFLATIWLSTPDDVDVKYEQKVSIVAEHDQKITKGTDPMEFVLIDDVHKLVQPIRISCRRAGRFTFELFLKRQDSDDWGEPKAKYPFTLLEPQPMAESVEPYFTGKPIAKSSTTA